MPPLKLSGSMSSQTVTQEIHLLLYHISENKGQVMKVCVCGEDIYARATVMDTLMDIVMVPTSFGPCV